MVRASSQTHCGGDNSEFELLSFSLLSTYRCATSSRKAEFMWHKLSASNMDPDFVERRRISLENVLLRVASHSILHRDKIFYLFLTQEGNWKEAVNETGFQLKSRAQTRSTLEHSQSTPGPKPCAAAPALECAAGSLHTYYRVSRRLAHSETLGTMSRSQKLDEHVEICIEIVIL
ncbi:sorting nexin-4-like [Nannospalax galili]|uniref:sorting nexin-4-like n=1 Tax=Nannospalax galili TaxID=1026970 RepID=UPI00081A1FC4|nr:sorting nexin-4-like [Nannospalax galili]